MCSALEHAIERRHQRVELTVASNQCRGQPVRVEPARRSRSRERALHAVDRYRRCLSFEGDLAEGLETERVLRQQIGGLADEDMPRTGCTLNACRDIHGVPGHRVRGIAAAADVSCDDRTGVDADVQRQRLLQPTDPVVAQRGDLLDHGQRGAHGALGIVFVRGGRAEHGQHGVAYVFLHEAVEPRNGLGQLLEQVALERAYVFGVEPFAQRRKPGEIGEQHGHRPAVGFFILWPSFARRWGEHLGSDRGRNVSARRIEPIAALGAKGKF